MDDIQPILPTLKRNIEADKSFAMATSGGETEIYALSQIEGDNDRHNGSNSNPCIINQHIFEKDHSTNTAKTTKDRNDIARFWKLLGKCFSNTPFCIIVLLCSSVVSAGLGYVSVFLVQPSPYFDKSLDAFQIPNHISTLRNEMLFLAKTDFSALTKDRFQRDASNNFEEEYPHEFDKTSSKFRFAWDRIIAQSSSSIQVSDDQSVKHAVFRRSSPGSYRYRSSTWRLELVYMAKPDNESIFTSERLDAIHKVEMGIMGHSQFSRFCSRGSNARSDLALERFTFCNPPNSLLTYFYPSNINSQIRYDGVGSQLADIEGTLSKAMQDETFYWYVDPEMDVVTRHSRFIRTEFWFGHPIGEDNILPSDEQFKEYTKFLISLKELLDCASTDEVDVLYGGNELFDYEVSTTIQHDLFLAIPTLVAIAILLFVLTSFSLWLTFWGIGSILCSFSWAYFSYHVLWGKEALGLLNLVSAFVVIGIGVDDVFVFINTFRQAEHIKDSALRIGHTINRAGVATFFTSVTTAGAFGANMASQIKAIHEFGLFMMLIVSYCWMLVVIIMPAALHLWHKYIHCEIVMFKSCKKKDNGLTVMTSALWNLLVQSHDALESNLWLSSSSDDDDSSLSSANNDGMPLDDRDILMHDIEDVEPCNSDFIHLFKDDEPILKSGSVLIQQFTHPNTHSQESASLTTGLQFFLYKCVATPIVKWRWLVIGGYIIMLIVTAALVAHITPASRPPALFREDTNLQQLLDLAYNFSEHDISCKTCSGFSKPPIFVKKPTHKEHFSTERPAPKPPSAKRPTVVSTERPNQKSSSSLTAAHIIPEDSSMSFNQIQLTTRSKSVSCAEAKKNCKYGAICKRSTSGQPYCSCAMQCDNVMDPVCDNFSVTHVNDCWMRRSGCLTQLKISIKHKGVCSQEERHIYIPPSEKTGTVDENPIEGESPLSPEESVPKGYNPCSKGTCGKAAAKPILHNTATVFVVFGVEGIDKTNTSEGNIIKEQKGRAIYDMTFDITRMETQAALCTICKNLASREDLVKHGGAQCFPSRIEPYLDALALTLPECSQLPKPNLLNGQKSKSTGRVKGQKAIWFAMAFESNIYEGQSSFSAYHDYVAWEAAINNELNKLTPDQRVGLETMFQTCDYWEQIFMEIIGVTSAIYGLGFSLLVCIVAVILFTAHIGILLIALSAILGVILVVVSFFFLMGWEMGAVEAVSLSILVGSSVDYCIHLIEGYLVAGKSTPFTLCKPAEIRRWRTKHAVRTIGVSILSSALTTIIAAIPLCFTDIQLFSKFGKIVAINTFVSIFYTLTACTAFLGTFAPSRYQWSWKWLIVSSVIIIVLFMLCFVALYVLSLHGIAIPGPSGNSLF